MLIQALYELAEREGLGGHDEAKRVDVVIALARDGAPLSVTRVSNAKHVTLTRVPRMPTGRAGATANPGLLYDNASYVLGVGKVSEARAAAFLVRAREVMVATGDAGAQAVVSFCASPAHRKQAAAMLGEPWTGSEWCAFTLSGEEGYVHGRPQVAAFWAAERQKPAGREIGLCLITGKVGPVERLHPMVKMPGTKGAALVSYNAPAFESFGREQGQNAPMSRDAVEGYVDALHWLLERTSARRHRGGLPLGEDVLLVWAREPGVDVDMLLDVLDGQRPMTDLTGEEQRVYAVLLGTNRTRIVVKSWIDTTAAELVAALRAYAVDLGLATGDVLPTATVFACALGTDRRMADLSPGLRAALGMAPFSRAPLPRALLGMALDRARKSDLAPWRATTLIHLMSAVLRRGGTSTPMALDDTCTTVPYVLGRLFAFCESEQIAAHGWRVGADLRSRLFSAAMRYPASTWPRLLALSNHHGQKLWRRKQSFWHERQKDVLLGLLTPAPLPVAFTLEEQGLFALGYHHQRAVLMASQAPQPTPTSEAKTE